MNFIAWHDQKIFLKNGLEIKHVDEVFKPLQEIDNTLNTRDVCPITEACDYNNCFDCEVYGMFMGCCLVLGEIIDLCTELRELRQFKKDVILDMRRD